MRGDSAWKRMSAMRHRTRSLARRLCAAAAFGLVVALWNAPVVAQVGEIVASPAAVKLRLLWARTTTEAGTAVGTDLAAIRDIDGDGRDEVLVGTNVPKEIRLYRGDSAGLRLDGDWRLSGPHAWRGTSSNPDFFGDGRRFLMLVGRGLELEFYPIDSGRIATTPTMIWPRGTRADSPGVRGNLDDFIVADLNNDGADELIVFIGFIVDTPEPRHSQVWIYEGGANFQLETPTTVLRETIAEVGNEPIGGVGDFDGDGHVDIGMLQNPTSGAGKHLMFWFGDGELPDDGALPDRSVNIEYGWWTVVNVDGDSTSDILTDRFVFHSAGGRSARTRTFNEADADVTLLQEPGYGHQHFGPMNNRSRRYDMVGTTAYDVVNGGQLRAFSGGPNGPDGTYDGVFYESDHGFLGSISGRQNMPAGDVNGDGWPDFLGSNPRYFDRTDRGVVVVLAGGPYIPVDDPSMGVREVVTGERPRSVFIWPMPAVNELNIAWRGDLERMPARFEVFDIRGSLVARGAVDPYVGAALWRCGDAPPGTYVLRVLDEDEQPIGTAAFVKQ
jgi:hypothetical protein